MRKNSRAYPISWCLAIACILFVPAAATANVKLPAIFSDGMVLQQNSRVAVWGWADPGETIVIRGSWPGKDVSVTADGSGKWKTALQTPKAGGPYAVTVKGRNTIELKDVLIGEVWVCSGQSNMVFSLKSDAEAKEEIATANYPSIRYFSVKRQYGAAPFTDAPGSAWQMTTPQTAASFSAVAYFFAKKIHEQLKVPVGIVYSAWGGTPAEAWTPGYVLRDDTSLSVYIDRWKNIQEKVGNDSAAYFHALTTWRKDSMASKKPAEPQTYYYYQRPWREPAVLFNGMINPVIPYGVKGILWYQGESNVAYAGEYFHLFGSMIESWRKKWNKGRDLPFYFVQISAFGYSDMDAAARLREAQFNVMKNVPNTGMAVTADLGNMDNIHYTHKRKVGERLALIALAKDYGHREIKYKGPECTKAIAMGKKIVLEFGTSVLVAKDEEVMGFEIGYALPGSDSVRFEQAEAKLDGNKVVLSTARSEIPAGIRYAWLLPDKANLFDQDGLPAFPFRKTISVK